MSELVADPGRGIGTGIVFFPVQHCISNSFKVALELASELRVFTELVYCETP
jgi:hypothetical protein